MANFEHIYESMADLKREVEENQGVITTSMLRLRNAYGADRLGVHVRENISNALKANGLAHFPRKLPERQDGVVRVYKIGSPVAQVFRAVLALDGNDSHDQRLRDLSSNSAMATLDRIKEIVCG